MPKILIVEDNLDLRRSLTRLLESEGYVVEQAENGAVALAFLLAATELPTAILLDLMMPVMDGFEFRARQIENARLASIPVGIMSADGHIAEKMIRAKVKMALQKPADIEAILDMVEKLCA